MLLLRHSDILIKVQKNLAYKLITVSVALLLAPNPTSLPKSPCQEHSKSVVSFFGGPKFTRLDLGWTVIFSSFWKPLHRLLGFDFKPGPSRSMGGPFPKNWAWALQKWPSLDRAWAKPRAWPITTNYIVGFCAHDMSNGRDTVSAVLRQGSGLLSAQEILIK